MNKILIGLLLLIATSTASAKTLSYTLYSHMHGATVIQVEGEVTTEESCLKVVAPEINKLVKGLGEAYSGELKVLSRRGGYLFGTYIVRMELWVENQGLHDFRVSCTN